MPIRPARSGLLLAVALAVSLTACSTPEAPTASPPSSAPPSTTGPRDSGKHLPPYTATPFVDEPAISEEVIRRFGKARATRTYQDVVAFMRAEALDMDRLRSKEKYVVSDFASTSRRMLPPTRKYWRTAVGKALKGSRKDADSVQVMTFWNAEADGFTFAKTGPPVVNERVDQSVLSIDKDTNWLSIKVTYGAWLRMSRTGLALRRPVGKQLTLVVIPGDRWLLVSYVGTWNIGNPLYE